MIPPRFVVGAYAGLPADPAAYYALLATQPWIDGLELPVRTLDASDLAASADILAPHWTNTVTAIPATMGRLADDPAFGLASPDPDGRTAALRHARAIRDAVATLVDAGARIGLVQFHSAPTRIADADSFARSLDELTSLDWRGAALAIEHCDAWTTEHGIQKGFLSVETEIDLAHHAGVGVLINWGRSALEARDPDAPLAHVSAARDAGVLSGIIFSGAGDESSPWGGAWVDIHLPAWPDEPTSLMTPERITACVAAAGDAPWLGTKLSMPAGASLGERLALVRSVADAAGVAR